MNHHRSNSSSSLATRSNAYRCGDLFENRRRLMQQWATSCTGEQRYDAKLAADCLTATICSVSSPVVAWSMGSRNKQQSCRRADGMWI